MITERDHVARRHPGVAEPKRGGVRASVELAVGDGLPFGGHGRRVGLGGATLADEIGHTFGAWPSRSGVPFDQLTSLLGRREDRHARRGLCRIGGDGGDDRATSARRLEPRSRPRRDRGRISTGRRGGPRVARRARARGRAWSCPPRCRSRSPFDAATNRDRAPPGRAPARSSSGRRGWRRRWSGNRGRGQLARRARAGRAPSSNSLRTRCSSSVNCGSPPRSTRSDQGCQAVADDRLELRSLAQVGGGRKDDVLLARVAAEEQRPARREDLEQGRSGTLADRPKAIDEVRRDGQGDDAATKARRRGSRSVERQRQLGGSPKRSCQWPSLRAARLSRIHSCSQRA